MQGGGTGPYVVKTICNGNQRHRLGQRGMPIVLLTHIPETRYSDVVQKTFMLSVALLPGQEDFYERLQSTL